MNPKNAMLKAEILHSLEVLGESALDEVHAYVTALARHRGSARESLAGIWEDQGFERLSDIESEIREARHELGDAISRRSF